MVMTITEVARRGGESTKTKYGSEHYRRCQRLSCQARRRKKMEKEAVVTEKVE
jgi:hypothetical protein